jgi:hypothetical protein
MLEGRRALSIGVAHRQLVIEGVMTDSRHPVMSDLAKRLHEHQLGAMSFLKGTQARDVEGLLAVLARDPERDGDPIGLLPRHEIPSWPHITLFPVGYDQLSIKESGDEDVEPDRATQLWLGLAQSVMAADRPLDPEAAADTKALARVIQLHRKEEAYDQVIVGYLLQLAEQLKDESSGEAEKIRRRVSSLIKDLDDATLGRLVEMGGDFGQRKRFLLDANHSLAVDSVVKVLTAAAGASGQTISTSFTRMLSKLALHADQGSEHVRTQADTALRENVEDLIADWELTDPNPDQYTTVLDAMSRATPLFAEKSESEDTLLGSQRILEMAIEVDAHGPTVEKAVADLLDQGESRVLLRLVDEAPESSRVARHIRGQLASPGHLRRLLSGEDVDEDTLATLVERMGAAAVDPMLDVLAESDSRSVRRKVFDVLSRLGPVVAERAVERLDDKRWFVLRNMLALLQRLDDLPADFDPLVHTKHADHRVRREAFALAVRDGSLRERTLASALAERDERLVRMALLELQPHVPDTLVPVVVNRVLNAEHTPEIRAMGAKVLRNSRVSLARDALLGLAVAGKSMFGRVKLAESSPVLVAALSALAASWSQHPGVKEVLELAARSKDPRVREAVKAGRVG